MKRLAIYRQGVLILELDDQFVFKIAAAPYPTTDE